MRQGDVPSHVYVQAISCHNSECSSSSPGAGYDDQLDRLRHNFVDSDDVRGGVVLECDPDVWAGAGQCPRLWCAGREWVAGALQSVSSSQQDNTTPWPTPSPPGTTHSIATTAIPSIFLYCLDSWGWLGNSGCKYDSNFTMFWFPDREVTSVEILESVRFDLKLHKNKICV